MTRLLEGIEFRNPARAREDVARIGDGIPEGISARIEYLLAAVPDPDRGLHFLERLRRNPPAFERIVSSRAALRYAITIFSYSNFLSEVILQSPERLLQVAASGDMYRLLSAEEFEQRIVDFLGGSPGVPSALSLARFRRHQLLRIVLRDVLGLARLPEITEELSNLADAILDFSFQRIRDELVTRYGEPRMGNERCGFSVISLGKLGGRELNYSSDIDLMFLYAGSGETEGPERITNKEFYKKVANQYTALLSTYNADGLCYRVDLRLRPDGKLGEIAISLDGAKSYYSQRARDWEKQMLIKARVSAGDRDLGRQLLEFVEPLIYSSTLDFRAVEAVSEARLRISEKLAAKRSAGSGLDVKLAPGGIRDIEFLVQCLQRLHGGRETWVRHGGTLVALFRLRDKRLLSDSEYARLASSYQFFRHVEHRLQLEEDRQTHTLPTDPQALELLARKLPADASGRLRDAESLLQQIRESSAEVLELYERVIHAQKPIYYTPVEVSSMESETVKDIAPGASNLSRFLDVRAPRLAAWLGSARIRRGRERLDHFLEDAMATPSRLAQLDSNPSLIECVVDLFEHSHHFGDQLLRYPELLDDLNGGSAADAEPLDDVVRLRRFFRRQMFRIQSQSVCGRTPIFATLARTSDLADQVIVAAYQIALAETPPPTSSSYVPRQQMMVIALGRLGMREFDLDSDADLIFVIPDEDASEILFWTAVAERMIQAISAYTGEGVIFAVDTRLRPNGREGALVQSEGAYKSYFGNRAEAWEGISYMKARAVAGNLERATEFLNELQQVDWRHYGQSGRSRSELAQMRARLEREQGARNPLKAGMGGYYDIDFALMYLRLKSAGIFFRVLNTPERIDVVEKMGHLDREDADFLRDAATFYRAVDHGLRIASGHAQGSLPKARSQFDMITELVRRWTPEHLHDQPLDIELSQIRTRTREFYNRLFG